MNKIAKKIHSIINIIIVELTNNYKKAFYFYLPNIKIIFSKRLKLNGDWPKCVQPTYFTGSGSIEVGHGCAFGYKLGGYFRKGSIEFQARYKNSVIVIESNVLTNNNIFICSANYVKIGNKTLIGQYVTIMDHEGHGIDPNKRQQIGEIGSVTIGNNVWIGNNVTILKNTTIGDNSIIAAGAVVSGKFNSNVILGGVPAKVINNI